METLPLPLFSSVVAFAVPNYTEEIMPEERQLGDAVPELKNLAYVSKSWLASVRQVVRQFQWSTLTLKFKTASPEELLQMRQRVLTRGPQVTDLRVSMGSVGFFGEDFTRDSRLPASLDTMELEWDALIVHMPGLRRLDLSHMPLCSPQTQKVVEAATKFCRDMEALVLPGKESETLCPGDAEVGSLLSAVYRGLESWRPAGGRTGLRQLKVPTINEKERFRSSREFFDNVVKFCPQVEYLDGYDHTLCHYSRLTCWNAWMLNLADWEKFNATCTNIRQFDWVVAPFGDPFFRVFGEYPKPRLQKLVFCINMLWDWGRYFHEMDNEEGRLARTNNSVLPRASYGRLAEDASTALLGCPRLEELFIILYHPLGDADVDDRVDRNQEYFPVEEAIEMEIFNDHFCETLAASCPLIKSIGICEIVDELELEHIHSFTDRGLAALAQLKYLEHLELRPVNCTGNGIFEFLSSLSLEFTGQRTITISVGGKSALPDTTKAFYTAVMSFLTRIADTPARALQLSQHRIVLRLRNGVTDHVEKDWSEQYIEGLKEVVDRVKETHLSLRLRVTASDCNCKSFRRLEEIGLYVAHATPSYCYWWDEEESDRGVVFVSCGGLPCKENYILFY